LTKAWSNRGTLATWAAHYAHYAHNRTALAHYRRAHGAGGGHRAVLGGTRGIREVP
jgi:hypothetical protein